jgi:hypothetical protein
MNAKTVFQAWFYTNENPAADLAEAEKTWLDECDTLDEAQQALEDANPDTEAFIHEYRVENGKIYELVAEHARN